MNYEIVGKLIFKEETQHISDRFQKREFVIEVGGDGDDYGYRAHVNYGLIIIGEFSIFNSHRKGDTVYAVP